LLSDRRFDLSNKTTLVVGGSRGLGRAIALEFGERGANVIVASRAIDACEALAIEINARWGRRALGLSCHVGKWGDCEKLVGDVYGQFERVDVLVNCAGMSPLYPSLADVTEGLYDKVLAVNLRGPFRLATLVGSQMVAHGGGSIINITSIASVRPTVDALPYSMAKAGLNAMTHGMALAFAPTVRVNAIMPGHFQTDVSKAWEPTETARLANNRIPLRRIADPDEIVGMAVYLASDASSFATGAVFTVDGGETLG
jgi:NAD(P)-dependent dehydrogenase (short-subunit alcohol dehydrogenase family)